MKDASLSLVTKEIFKLNIERTPQLVESSGVFLVYDAFLYMAFSCIWRFLVYGVFLYMAFFFVYGVKESS